MILFIFDDCSKKIIRKLSFHKEKIKKQLKKDYEDEK
tara:strand:- start:2101 stop:2211 length:111 start_codon:yes stop_codon:yes gene_type:complete